MTDTAAPNGSHLKLYGSPSALKIGELLIKEGLIEAKNVSKALTIQEQETDGESGIQRTVGEILCDLKLISASDLNLVLQKYSKQLKLGDILLRQDSIDKQTLTTALAKQSHGTDPLGKVLLKNNLIEEEQLYEALSRQCNIPYKSLDDFFFKRYQLSKLSAIVGRKYAQKNKILPLSIEGDLLTLAVYNPEKAHIIQELSAVYSQYRMQAVLITEKRFNELFGRLYGVGLDQPRIEKAKRTFSENVDLLEISLENGPTDRDDTSIYGVPSQEAERTVNFIIKYGIQNNASDIHIEQDRSGARLRYRFDGVLHTLRLKWLDQILQESVTAIISKIKVMSNLDIAEKRRPQDGVFRVNYHDRNSKQHFDLDFRVASCPAIVGENITIRILDSRKANVGLDKLNHSEHILTPLKVLLKSSAGMVLVTGPTGSGKSSTLYAALRHIYHPGIKIITAEDPIEYSFPGIMQTQIKPKIELSFARLLRSFLRLDPDVILVGEIRDEETAKIGFDAAQTGHLILSTLHTNDAVSAVSRLLDLNIEHNQIASSLMGVLAQRLIRRICPHCRKPYHPHENEWNLLFEQDPRHILFFKGEGCPDCDFTGYRGRTLISELMVVNDGIARALNRGVGEKEIRRLADREGMQTMVEDGLIKLEQTTLPEIIRVVPHEMIKTYKTGRGRLSGPRADIQATIESPPAAGRERIFRVISDPDTETARVDDLFKQYRLLNRKIGKSIEDSDRHLFAEFVSTHHHAISTRFDCRRVAFHLNATIDKIEISAAPQLESEPRP